MSPARATLLLGLAIAASAAACRDANHRRRPTPSFHSDELASRKIRRVVLAPFEDEARTGPARAAIQDAFAHGFEKATSVEVVAIDAMAHMEAAQDDRPRRTGQYHLESILELALRHDADGVLFGTITSYRAYAPQSWESASTWCRRIRDCSSGAPTPSSTWPTTTRASPSSAITRNTRRRSPRLLVGITR